MYSSRVDSNGNINTIVDEEWNIIAVANSLGFLCDSDKLGSDFVRDKPDEKAGLLTSAVSARFSRI
jgi:hypothetical protein